jgi:hypothetical protein
LLIAGVIPRPLDISAPYDIAGSTPPPRRWWVYIGDGGRRLSKQPEATLKTEPGRLFPGREEKSMFNLNVTKEDIIEIAKDNNGLGGYVNTDGAWCDTRTPRELAEIIESLGFVVVSAIDTPTCTARITTADGYVMSWNGFVRKISQ